MKTTIHRGLISFALSLLLSGASGCTRSSTNPWDSQFSPPETLDTDRVHLEPLAPRHAEMDLAAALSSREHLLRTLHWGTWPRADMTVDQNRRDLARHWKEFEERKGYAYTVLRPDRQKCLGCVYLSPAKDDHEGMELAYWVIEDELASDLDAHLLTSVIGWIRTKWPFETFVMPLHQDNQRGVRLAENLGLNKSKKPGDKNETYVWRRN